MSKSVILRNIIENRKSTFPRSYQPGQIAPEILNEIISSADFAPSHKRTRPWRFRLFESEEKQQLGIHLADIYRRTTPSHQFLEKKHEDISRKIDQAAAVVTISANFSGLVPEWEEIAATAMAVQNMYLTCEAHGVGCYWSTPGIAAHLKDLLELDENQRCLGLFYLGVVAEDEK